MKVGTVLGTMLVAGAIASAAPSPAQLFRGPHRMRQPYMSEEDLAGSGREVSMGRLKKTTAPESRLRSDRTMIAISRARLSYNRWLRSHRAGHIDIYCTHIIAAKLYVETCEDRRVTMQSLAREVAPEFVTLSTALSYVRDFERRGFVLIDREGRDRVVVATDKFFTYYEARITRMSEALEEAGCILPNDPRYVEPPPGVSARADTSKIKVKSN